MRGRVSTRVPNLFLALRAHAASRPAISDGFGTYTYGSLLRRAEALRASLDLPRNEGNDPHRVAIFTNPQANFVTALLATWASPAAAVPLSPLYPPNALEPLLEDAEPAVIIAEKATLPGLPETHSSRVLLTESAFTNGSDHDQSSYTSLCDTLSACCALSPRDSALVMFTSGTTGRSKGVVWRHSMVDFQVRTLFSAWRWSGSDRILNVLPLHHIHGLVNVVLTALYAGAHVEMHPGFDADRVWRAFTRAPSADPLPPTVFMAVPAVYSKLIRAYERAGSGEKKRMSEGAGRLRLFVCGSASLSRRDFEAWERICGHRILERYGMTEGGMMLSNEYERREQGTLGVALPGVETRVESSDRDDAGQGQLLVRGAGVFEEYWGRKEATRECFTKEGWFETGDVVRREAGSGVFRMMGRASSDIIKTGGYKVSAIEIEETLRECPGVGDCAVVGVEDEVLGECIVAAVIVSEEEDEEEEGEGVVEEAREWAMKKLPMYKVPRRIVVVEEFPRNVLGKVQKQVLKGAVK